MCYCIFFFFLCTPIFDLQLQKIIFELYYTLSDMWCLFKSTFDTNFMCVFLNFRSSENRTDFRTGCSCFTDTQIRKYRSQRKIVQPDRWCLFDFFISAVCAHLSVCLCNQIAKVMKVCCLFFSHHSGWEFSCKCGRRFIWRRPEKNTSELFRFQLCYLWTS